MLSMSIHLMQSVAFSINSCQRFEGYQIADDASLTNQPISPDGRKTAPVNPYFPSSQMDNHIHECHLTHSNNHHEIIYGVSSCHAHRQLVQVHPFVDISDHALFLQGGWVLEMFFRSRHYNNRGETNFGRQRRTLRFINNFQIFEQLVNNCTYTHNHI